MNTTASGLDFLSLAVADGNLLQTPAWLGLKGQELQSGHLFFCSSEAASRCLAIHFLDTQKAVLAPGGHSRWKALLCVQRGIAEQGRDATGRSLRDSSCPRTGVPADQKGLLPLPRSQQPPGKLRFSDFHTFTQLTSLGGAGSSSCDWLTSLRVVSLRFVHVPPRHRTPLSLKAAQCSVVEWGPAFFIHSPRWTLRLFPPWLQGTVLPWPGQLVTLRDAGSGPRGEVPRTQTAAWQGRPTFV